MKKTSTIRKLPRRETRKELRPYFRNPLQQKKPQELVLPSQLRYLLKQKNISLRSIQEPLKKPQRSSIQLLKEIRKATQMQENKMQQIRKIQIKASEPKKKVVSRKRLSASTLLSLNQNSMIQAQIENLNEQIQLMAVQENPIQNYQKYEQEDNIYNFDTFKDQDRDGGWKNINVDRLIYFSGEQQQRYHCGNTIDFLHQ